MTGRFLLIARLAARDLRHRPAQAASARPRRCWAGYMLNLKLSHPADAVAFVNTHSLVGPSDQNSAMTTWQQIQNADNDLVSVAQQVLTPAVSSGGSVTIPATSCLAAVVLGTLAAVALPTAIPAGLGARWPAAPVRQAGAA